MDRGAISKYTIVFLNDRPIACSWYIKNRKKPHSSSFYFLFKILQRRDIIHSEKSGICSDRNRKLGFDCWLQVEMVGKCQMQVFTYLISAHFRKNCTSSVFFLNLGSFQVNWIWCELYKHSIFLSLKLFHHQCLSILNPHWHKSGMGQVVERIVY